MLKLKLGNIIHLCGGAGVLKAEGKAELRAPALWSHRQLVTRSGPLQRQTVPPPPAAPPPSALNSAKLVWAGCTHSYLTIRADSLPSSRVPLPGQTGRQSSSPTGVFDFGTLPSPTWSPPKISPLSPAFPGTGSVREADPHGNGTSHCFPNPAFVTPQGPSNSSKGCHGILKTESVLIHPKFKNTCVSFCGLGLPVVRDVRCD